MFKKDRPKEPRKVAAGQAAHRKRTALNARVRGGDTVKGFWEWIERIVSETRWI
jgi:hypothetical protein